MITLIVLVKLGETQKLEGSATLDHAQIQRYRHQQKQKLWATLRITVSSRIPSYQTLYVTFLSTLFLSGWYLKLPVKLCVLEAPPLIYPFANEAMR